MKNIDKSKLRAAVQKQALGMVGDLEIIYRLLGWRWHDKKRTPTKEELLDGIMRLANNVIDDCGSWSSGGLCAEWDKEDQVMTISFCWSKDVYLEEK